jgi:anti-anti-sigma factor
MSPTATVISEIVEAKVPVSVLHLHGGLDLKSEEVLWEAAKKAHEVGARLLVIDLAGVDRITSAGMRTLTKIFKLFTPEAEDGKKVNVRMCGGLEQITSVLEMTGFLKRIPHHDSLQAARDAFV